MTKWTIVAPTTGVDASFYDEALKLPIKFLAGHWVRDTVTDDLPG